MENLKKQLLKQMDEVKKELKDLNDYRDFILEQENYSLEENNLNDFEMYSKEFISIGEIIIKFCKHLNCLSNEYTKLVLNEYKQKKDTSIEVSCSTLGQYLETLKDNNIICIPFICGDEYKVKEFINSEIYKDYKYCFVNKVVLNSPDFEYGILIYIDNVA